MDAAWGWDKMNRHFEDDIFKCMPVFGSGCISKQNSLSLDPKDPTDNNPSLVQIVAWRRSATSHYLNQWRPSLLMHIFVTRSWKDACLY